MNVPKIVAILVVVAVAVGLLYPTLNHAIPKDLNGNPFEIAFDESGTTSVDMTDMNITISLPDMTFSSKLPEDFKDVKITIYAGSGDKKIAVGNFDMGVIPANGSKTEKFVSETIPALYFMSFVPSMSTSSGVNFPLYLDIAFKYMEWQGTELIDLNIGMQVQGTSCPGNVTLPEVSGTTSEVTLSADSGMPKAIVDQIKTTFPSGITASAGGATFSATVDSSDKLIVQVSGTDALTAAEVLQKMYEENDGDLTFTYDAGGTPKSMTISKEKAEALIKSLDSFYPKAVS